MRGVKLLEIPAKCSTDRIETAFQNPKYKS
jgi:hypothetical protein